ncbi:MAG: ATP-binding protein [Acidimicrobiales bacterium]
MPVGYLHRSPDATESEMRKLIRCDLLILDDFGLHSFDQTETQDIYEIVVERHLRASTIITSNRDPSKAHRFGRTCAKWRLKLTGRRRRGPRSSYGHHPRAGRRPGSTQSAR